MENKLQLFNYQDQDVRAVWIEDENDWWYVLVDVCKILDLDQPSRVIGRVLFPEGVTQSKVPTKGGMQNATCVSLPNYLYIISRSDTDEAKLFQKWVWGEVIPKIFMTGSYSLNDDLLVDLKKWQLSTKVIEAIVKAVQSRSVLDDKERAGYAAVLLQTLRRQIYHDTRSYEGTLEVLYGKGALPDIKGDIAKMTAEIKNGQVIVQLQFPFDTKQ